MNIDWNQYFKEFSAYHGGDPVLVYSSPEDKSSGRLLFPDGWMYSCRNPSGPEYPPPEDPDKHTALIRQYWTIKKVIVATEYRQLKQVIKDLVQVQRQRSTSLQISRTVPVEDDIGRVRYKRQTNSIDFQELLDRLKELRNEILVCDEHLNNPAILENTVVEFNPAAILTAMEEIEREK